MSKENEPLGTSEWLMQDGIKLEDKVSCDGTSCDNAADKYLKTKCCGEVIFACDECIENAFQKLVGMLGTGKILVCKVCDTVNSPKSWLSKPVSLRT